jgi:hypothetical protein
VTREIEDESFANSIADQAGAGAARRNRKICVGCRVDDEASLLCTLRKCDPTRLNLVNRRVRRVQLTRKIIKARVAPGLPDFPFLRGRHSGFSTLRFRRGLESALDVVAPFRMSKRPGRFLLDERMQD